MYIILKHSHLLALTLSFSLFFIRGFLMMRQSSAAGNRFFLIAPHIVNAGLIGTGIALAITLQISPSSQPWLMAKLIALVIYIVLGVMTFKHPNLKVRKILWLLALVVFAFMVSVARSKSPWGFLSFGQ